MLIGSALYDELAVCVRYVQTGVGVNRCFDDGDDDLELTFSSLDNSATVSSLAYRTSGTS